MVEVTFGCFRVQPLENHIQIQQHLSSTLRCMRRQEAADPAAERFVDAMGPSEPIIIRCVQITTHMYICIYIYTYIYIYIYIYIHIG